MKKDLIINNLIKIEKSSNIEFIGYNDDTAFVQFKNGSIYSYPETKKEEFEALTKAESIGSFFSKSFKTKKFNKLENVTLVKKEKDED